MLTAKARFSSQKVVVVPSACDASTFWRAWKKRRRGCVRDGSIVWILLRNKNGNTRTSLPSSDIEGMSKPALGHGVPLLQHCVHRVVPNNSVQLVGFQESQSKTFSLQCITTRKENASETGRTMAIVNFPYLRSTFTGQQNTRVCASSL